MNIKVERFYSAKLKLEIEIQRHPDSRLKSIDCSTGDYEFWMDENGFSTWMRKDRKFDELILKLIDGYEEALIEQLE